MTLREALAYQRCQAHYIRTLALRGDQLARTLICVYWELYGDQLNVAKQNEYLKVIHDYAYRDHMIAERKQLADRLGHKVPDVMQ